MSQRHACLRHRTILQSGRRPPFRIIWIYIKCFVQWQEDGFVCFLKYVVRIDFGDGSQQPLVHLSRYNSVAAMALNGCIVHK